MHISNCHTWLIDRLSKLSNSVGARVGLRLRALNFEWYKPDVV